MNSKYLINMMLEGKSAEVALNKAIESDDQDPHDPKVNQIWKSHKDTGLGAKITVKITDISSTDVTVKPCDDKGKITSATPLEINYDKFLSSYKLMK